MIAKMDVPSSHLEIFQSTHRTGDAVGRESVPVPFGLRSAPLLFSAVADALAWIMHQRGVRWLDHYIDDFVTAGPQENVQAVCTETGWTHKKMKGQRQ